MSLNLNTGMSPLGYLIFFTGIELFGKATALSAWSVSAFELQRLYWVSTIIVGNWLYIEGGEYYLAGTSSLTQIQLPPTLSIDLSSLWANSTVTINQINKPSNFSGGAPGQLGQLRDPGLFWDESMKSIVVFGGASYALNPAYSIWSLSVGANPNGDGTWSQEYKSTDSIWQHITWPQHASHANSAMTGFSLGGYATTPGGASTPLLDMTLLNAINGNFSMISDIGRFSSGGVVEGVAQFIPTFGSGQGIVVFLGGLLLSTSGTSSLHSMSQVTIYDIALEKWYTQTASGDVPLDRKNMCIVGAQGINPSTYEIFIYGGNGVDYFSPQNSDSTTVYILTLPAFRWIRTSPMTAPRSGSSCQTIKNQMLSIGGWDPTGLANYLPLEPWNYGIGVFDLTALTWKTEFDPNAAAYVQSDPVVNFYAKNPQYPVWDSNTTAPLFTSASFILPSFASSPTSATSTPSSTSGGSSANQSSSPPVAAIVGGTVGGVCVFAAILTAVWFYCLRPAKRAKRNAHAQDHTRSHDVSELHETQTHPELDTLAVPEMENPHNYSYLQNTGQGRLSELM